MGDEFIADAIRKLGIRRVASLLGVSRDGVLALAVGVAQPGTRALAAQNRPRLRRELE